MTKMFCNKNLFLLLFIVFDYGEGYNLFGEAGQAYSIEIDLGNPKQKLNVIVDTGSTTLAIASYPRREYDKYFKTNNSTTLEDSGMQIQARYSQGNWVGRLVSDLVEIPSLPNIPAVRANMAIITKSYKFFVNGSGWQGLLGLAYLPVGAWGEHVIVESWLDSVDAKLQRPTSFELKLCGPQSVTNATHYGNLRVIDDEQVTDFIYRTPILHKRWYEVGVLSVKVLANTTDHLITDGKVTYDQDYDVDMCRKLNSQKSIVDSGTTNIRLPDALFKEVVDQLKRVVKASNTQYPSNIILDNFWDRAEAGCWPAPQQWSLPWLGIDLLSADSDEQYFTLEIPPQNYMRVASAHNSTAGSGTVPEFCYKLGIEAGGKETVLGYTAMEGLMLLFNRSAGWIGFKTSDCGPQARITGPYNVTHSITTSCQLITPITDMAISIRAAQWALCVVSIVAATVLIYLLAPCVKMLLVRPLPRATQISMSQTALVDQDVT